MGLRMTEDHTELTFRYMRVGGRRENLIDFLIRRFRYLDREQWINNILNKRLLVDGGFALPGQMLRDHQKIVYLRPDFMEPEVDEYTELNPDRFHRQVKGTLRPNMRPYGISTIYRI